MTDLEDYSAYDLTANERYEPIVTNLPATVFTWGKSRNGNGMNLQLIVGEGEDKLAVFPLTELGGRQLRITVEALVFDGFEVEGG